MAALVFILSFLPGLFYLWVIRRQDKYDPEPRAWLAFTFFAGMLATFPAALVEQLVDLFVFPYGEGAGKGDLFSSAIAAFFVIGPVEELCKLLAILAVAANRALFDEPMDALVYAGAAALGFASLENSLYCMEYGSASYVMRAILTVPAHVCFAAVWAWGLGVWLLRARGAGGFFLFLASFAAAISLHGLWDLLLFTQAPLLVLMVLPLLLAMAGITALAFFHFRKISPHRWSRLPPGMRTAQRRAAEEKLRGGLSVGWIAGGTFIHAAVAVTVFLVSGAAASLLPGAGASLLTLGFLARAGEPPMLLALAVLTLLTGAAYFATGIVIGRLSRSRTIVEPAISAVLAVSLLFVLFAPSSGTPGLLAFLFMGPVLFGLSCLGGWIGERWQARAETRAGRPTPR